MKKYSQKVRGIIFIVGMYPFSVVWSILTLCLFWLKYERRYQFITTWSRFMLWWVRITCGIHYRVEGKENIPQQPVIIMSNHQSTWETFAYHIILPPHCNVLKKEYLSIPLFGWGLSFLEPIAIDRSKGSEALHQLLEEGKRRLAQGRPIVVFPEGTRLAPDETKKYGPGGALLASKSGYPVLLIAHNAGKFWPRRSWLKTPGTITVRIGPLIETKNRSAREINKMAKAWLDEQKQQLMHD